MEKYKRIRSKPFSTINGIYKLKITGSPYSSPINKTYFGNELLFDDNEVMTDYVDPGFKPEDLKAGSLNRNYFNYISHKKEHIEIDFSVNPDFNRWVFHHGPWYNYDIRIDGAYWWAHYGHPLTYTPTLATPASFEIEELWEAIVRIEPKATDIIPGFNLWAIVLELNKLKDLLGIFVVKADNLLKAGATKHLEYNFGIVPLIGDISAIYKIFQKLEGHIDKWNDLASKKQVINYHEIIKVDELTDSHHRHHDPGIHPRILCTSDTTVDSTSKYVAKLHCYGIPRKIPRNKRYEVYMRALGLDKPLSGAWEAVPFSWIVDYFTNTGDFINQWESQIDSLFKMDLISAGYSEKTETTYNVNVTETPKPNISDNFTYTASIGSRKAKVVVSKYKRNPLPLSQFFSSAKLALSNDMAFSMSLGWKQATYLGALAILKK